MNGAFYIGATGLQAQQSALDVIANNISNINTLGFKRSEARFATLMAAGLPGSEAAGPAGAAGQGMSGVMLTPSLQVFTPGPLQKTDQAMDVAIDGEGFIELAGPDGQSRLWRGGSLTLTADGFLAGAQGMPLKSAISAPTGATDIAIAGDGKVTAVLDGAQTATEIGRIELVMVRDMGGLAQAGNGLYRAGSPGDLITVNAGEEGAGRLVQGSLEGSNVQLSEEMVALLLMQRAYAANAQVLQAGDQLMSIANSLRR